MDPVEEDSSENIKGKLVPADVAKRNLDAVREALKHLGGKAFGANIVDYLCRNRTDMVRSFGGDKKRLRYCVNGLLSARVNSTYFEKKVYKDNGSTKTEWILAEPYEETEDLTVDVNTPVELSHSEDEDTEKDEMERDSESDTNTRSPKVRTPKRSTTSSRRRSLRQAQNLLRRPSRYTSEGGREETPRTRGARDFGDCFESINAIAEAAFEEHKEKVSSNIDIDDFDSEGDFQTGDTPLTYRGMIKAALEGMGGCGTFESISKFIGVHFKDQLTNKAETWKHSIAGCLSVYFARKEEKDNSGKVIWTLEDPPKPKRRIRKRDRDDIMSTNAERETTPRIISAKKRKDDMILISIEQLEALEEENECLKLLNVKKREEKPEASFSMRDHEKASCSCCLERKELCMKLTPCGHIFCGSIFCEASTSKTCHICKADVTQRLPYHQSGNIKILKGIFDTLANVVTSSSPEFDLVTKSAIIL